MVYIGDEQRLFSDLKLAGERSAAWNDLPSLGVAVEPSEALSELFEWLVTRMGFAGAYLALPNISLRQYLQKKRHPRLHFVPLEAEEFILNLLARGEEEVLFINGHEDGIPAFFRGFKNAAFPVPGRLAAGGCERVNCLFSRRARASGNRFYCWEVPFYSGDCCFKKSARGNGFGSACHGCALLPVSVVLVLQKEDWTREDVLAFMLASERCSLVMDDLFFRDFNERRQRLDATISKIATRMGEITDFRKAMNLLLSTAMALLAADRGSIYVYEEQSGELRFAAWHNLPENVDVSAPRKAESGIAAWVAKHGKPLILQDRVEGEAFKGIDPKVKSAISYPLFHKGELFGVLNLGITDEERRFCEADLRVLESLTAVGSIGMENAFLHRNMEEKEQLHRKLLTKIINAQEDERKRIASDIHDDTIQSLISCFYQLEAAEMMLEEENNAKALDLLRGIKKDLQRNITCMRRLLFDLRPSILDDAGLVPALEDYLNRLEEELDIRSFLYVDEEMGELDHDVGVSVYRMAQEIFSNVRKHARATEVEVKLYRKGKFLVMAVRDNGVGFDPERVLTGRGSEEHFGLRSLRERVDLSGGEMDIRSRPGGGTEVVIRIPVAV
ncbi:MAG: GAF domain-containing sensor histidine kinase [Actinomycetota bacterium]|nr:GAF domain-containing sensor histidine kinase [Actinomycetota bacterium]MDI7251965.1 GAF domain-containing sensor histidine kinase [Actinomycetota bacterium]